MQLFTHIDIKKADYPIYFGEKILFLGSCFSDNIGNRMSDGGFQSLNNPLGITYNPISLFRQLDLMMRYGTLDKSLVIDKDGLICHYDFHSSLNASTVESLLQNIESNLDKLSQTLKKTRKLFITFGTSIVHQLASNDRIINNCHKQPSQLFKKEILQLDDLYAAADASLRRLYEYNNGVQIVLTVSPIRHLRHGAIENNRSKSRLLLLCEHLSKQFDYVTYWPAYELLQDELRDYRWVESDLIHPNQMAIDIIWDRFRATYFDLKTEEIYQEVSKIKRSQKHQILNTGSDKSQKFSRDLEEKVEAFKKNYPEVVI